MSKKHKVLIAGCGYVGMSLANLLQEKDHEVVGLRRNWQEFPKQKFKTIEADLTIPGNIPEINGLTHIVYTASAGSFTDAAYKKIYVDGLRQVIEYAKSCNSLQRILFVSSTGIYGIGDGDEVDETTEVSVGNTFSSSRLIEAENLLQSSTLPFSILRFSGIYGPGRQRILDQVIDGSARRSPGVPQWTNRIHLDDCAGVLEFLLNLPDPESLYLCSDDLPALKDEILLWIANELKLDPPPSEQVTKMDQSPKQRGNRRVSNQKIKGAGYRFRYPTYKEGFGSLIQGLKR